MSFETRDPAEGILSALRLPPRSLAITGLALALLVSGCRTPKPTLIQGMVGATTFDQLKFPGGGTNPPATVDPAVAPTLGAALQQSFTPLKSSWDAGIEGGIQGGFTVNNFAFLAGGGGLIIAVDANTIGDQCFRLHELTR